MDDIETSPIADVEYEYDYEDYNYIDDTVKEPSKDKSSSKAVPATKPKTVIIITEPPTVKSVIVKDFPAISYNFKPIHQQSPPKFQHQPSPPKLHPKPRPASVHQTQPNYRYRFTPAELHYMYGKPRQQKPKPKHEQAAQTNPIQDLVKKLRNKVQKIVRFVTGGMRNPRKLFKLKF